MGGAAQMPAVLHWFKWERPSPASAALAADAHLLRQRDTYLVDPAKADLTAGKRWRSVRHARRRLGFYEILWRSPVAKMAGSLALTS